MSGGRRGSLGGWQILCVLSLVVGACSTGAPAGPSSASPNPHLGDVGMDAAVTASSCTGLPAPTLDDLWAKYFDPFKPTGCAVAGCHAPGARQVEFSNAHELWERTVARPTADKKGVLLDPGSPETSELYLRLLANAKARMPLGGPYLTSAALRDVAGYICAGALEPHAASAPGTNSDASTADGGVALSITGLSPQSGVVGSNLTIQGNGFPSDANSVVVSFGNVVAMVVSSAMTEIVVVVPDGATSGRITIEVGNAQAVSPMDFEVVIPNPSPTLAAIAPAKALAGSADLAVSLTGQNFVSVSAAELDGTMLPTAYIDGTKLHAVIPAAALLTAGGHAITVTTRGPGGGTSSRLPFQVDNPVPALTTATPSAVAVGATMAMVDLDGTGFVPGSVVTASGVALTTAFVSTTKLQVLLQADSLASPRTLQLVVANSAPGGGTSGALALNVENPAPTLTSATPSIVLAGAGSTQLTLQGTGFVLGSTVQLDGTNLVTTHVSGTELRAELDAALTAVASTHTLVVVNAGPGGGKSNSKPFAVNNPVPALSAVAPTSVATNGAAFTLKLTGTSFNASSVARFNGTDVATTYVNATTLNAQLPGIPTAGSYPVVVSNPTPGGGVSSAVSLAAVATTGPTITGLSPTSAAANTAFTLTVSGANYVCSGTPSKVKFGGVYVTVTGCTATSLNAAIPAKTAGSYDVQVINATESSTVASYAVVAPNPAPSIGSFAPAYALVGGAAFTLMVNGTGFVAGVTASWDGSARTTSFVSGTQLTMSIPSSDLGSVATHSVVVTNPAPGGGPSAPASFLVVAPNPIPTISALSPSSVLAGSGAAALTISGTGYTAASVASINGSARTTSYVSSTQLSVALTSGDTASAGSASITVANPTPGGGTSAGYSLTIIQPNPVPVVSSLSPSNATVGDPSFTLAVNGSGFVTGSVVAFNGVAATSTFVSSTQLTIGLSSADISTAGTFPIAVTNPAPGGGVSSNVNFTVKNPAPAITSLSPTSVQAASSATTVTVNGSGFVSSSVVDFDGSARSTHFVTANQLTFDVGASDVASNGTHSITVVNPTPGGGTSAAATFSVQNPTPSIASLSPCGKVAGAAAFTLTTQGGGFASGATATFRGTAVTVTYVSASQVTLAIPASLLTTAPTGNYTSVIITNPGPGGGASNAAIFGIASQKSTLASNVQTVFTASCATANCHVTGGTSPMSLASGAAYGSLVGVPSTLLGCGAELMVLACGPQRSQSTLIDKILSTSTDPACDGVPMPKGQPLTKTDKQTIIDWVAQGAPP